VSRLKQRAEQKRKQAQQASEESFWQDLCRRINDGQVIPIISNAVRCDCIFDIDHDQVLGVSQAEEDNQNDLTIEEQLAEAWAEELGYPLRETYRLARVAQYNRVVKSRDDLQAKARYLHFLKDSLLFLAEEDEAVAEDTLAELREELDQVTFSDIVRELECPPCPAGQNDPLRILAQLNLPIYITTSFFDFMEQALAANGRQPRSQICFWSGEPVEFADEAHRVDPDFIPSAEEPLVYHLYGLETYPESLVLSEDDFLDFLTRVSQDTSQENPVLPLYLRKALTKSSLLLLGYRLQDWDFRILFRGIINTTPGSLRKFSLAIQLDPADQQAIISSEEAREYLEKYFGSSNFNVEWGTTGTFVQKLWEAWEQWR
jgi:hypothetical protein